MKTPTNITERLVGTTWRRGADMPLALHSHARFALTCYAHCLMRNAHSAVIPGDRARALICGGVNASGLTTDQCLIYNSVSDSWQRTTSLPEALKGAALVAPSDWQMFLYGGEGSNGEEGNFCSTKAL